jgi:hypothetical protein
LGYSEHLPPWARLFCPRRASSLLSLFPLPVLPLPLFPLFMFLLLLALSLCPFPLLPLLCAFPLLLGSCFSLVSLLLLSLPRRLFLLPLFPLLLCPLPPLALSLLALCLLLALCPLLPPPLLSLLSLCAFPSLLCSCFLLVALLLLLLPRTPLPRNTTTSESRGSTLRLLWFGSFPSSPKDDDQYI